MTGPEPPRHWYHVWTGKHWEDIAAEHCAALHDHGWPHPVTVGLIGDAEPRAEARGWFRAKNIGVTEYTEANRGYEEQTLRSLWIWARDTDPATPVLYMHAKGTLNRVPVNDTWRRTMTQVLLTDWKQHLDTLSSYDAIGPYWNTPETNPAVPAPHFSGNFWYSTAGYLATLEAPEWHGSRFDAETWIGTGHPRILDVLPGWPPDDLSGWRE